MGKKEKVNILLATYNGEKYLDAQLDSIFTQTHQDFLVFVQDDYSTDSTVEIIEKWIKFYPEKIFLKKRKKNSGKPQINFMELVISQKSGSFFMFCDQDDVWLPNKIETSLNSIKSYEKKYGAETPILLGSEFIVVNKELEVCRKQKKKLDFPSLCEPNKLISYNIFTGCTIIYNKALAQHITSIPENCIIHDWWMAFIASAIGIADIIPESTLYYRQHENNVIGVESNRSIKYHIKRVKSILNNDYYLLANTFLSNYGDLVTEDIKNLIYMYTQLPSMSIYQRFVTINRYNYWAPGFLRKLYQLFR